jgi:Neprosin
MEYPEDIVIITNTIRRLRALFAVGVLLTVAGLVAPLGTGSAAAATGRYYYAGVMKATTATTQYGVGGRILIANPAIAYGADQVTSEMSIVHGANVALVETGYRKFGTAYPTLMIGYWSGGVFRDSAGFVTVHPTYRPGMSLAGYVDRPVQFYIRYDRGNWWVWFNDAWVGYFPGSLWAGTFTSGEYTHWYGEVYSTGSGLPLTDMGNGRFGSDPQAAYIDNMCQHGADTTCWWMNGASRSETDPSLYSLSYAGGTSLRHGGNGGG